MNRTAFSEKNCSGYLIWQSSCLATISQSFFIIVNGVQEGTLNFPRYFFFVCWESVGIFIEPEILKILVLNSTYLSSDILMPFKGFLLCEIFRISRYWAERNKSAREISNFSRSPLFRSSFLKLSRRTISRSEPRASVSLNVSPSLS